MPIPFTANKPVSGWRVVISNMLSAIYIVVARTVPLSEKYFVSSSRFCICPFATDGDVK